MNHIHTDELKAKLDRGDTFKLVMTLDKWAFLEAHIPNSINVSTPEQVAELLQLDDEIVVYCAGEGCPVSTTMYHYLVSKGYSNVWNYVGGLAEWDATGYPLVTEQVTYAFDD
jgi:rhodanese-related sulfurtransferase